MHNLVQTQARLAEILLAKRIIMAWIDNDIHWFAAHANLGCWLWD